MLAPEATLVLSRRARDVSGAFFAEAIEVQDGVVVRYRPSEIAFDNADRLFLFTAGLTSSSFRRHCSSASPHDFTASTTR